MKVYRTDEIRNVVLLGHGGSGKTSLVEAMLYVSGATNRMGKISESNTVSDFDKRSRNVDFQSAQVWFRSSGRKRRSTFSIHRDTSILSVKWKKRSAQRMQQLSSCPARQACRLERRRRGSFVISITFLE